MGILNLIDMKRVFSLIVMLLYSLAWCYSQENAFELSKLKSGHYAFPVKLNNQLESTALLESGIPAMLVDSAFVFNNLDKLALEWMPTDKKEKINLGGRVYSISHKVKGKMAISKDVTYEGDIFVLARYNQPYEVAIPVQNLSLKKKRSVLLLDLNNNLLKVCRAKDIADIKEYQKMAINTDTYLNMPAIRTELTVGTDRESTPLDGNFVIDFGNPMFLFLHAHNKNNISWIEGNNIELQKAYNQEGKVVAQAFMPKTCTMGNLEFKSVPIAITSSLPRFTSEGNLGLKFFQHVIAVFDFGKGYCYMK